MSTLQQIIDKKRSGEIKTKDSEIFVSEVLGVEIEVKKRSLSLFMDILTKYDIDIGDSLNSNPIPMMNEMIYEHCPMFKEPDAVKEAREFYGVARPVDLPEHVFEYDMEEMGKIMEVIANFYSPETLDDDIKN